MFLLNRIYNFIYSRFYRFHNIFLPDMGFIDREQHIKFIVNSFKLPVKAGVSKLFLVDPALIWRKRYNESISELELALLLFELCKNEPVSIIIFKNLKKVLFLIFIRDHYLLVDCNGYKTIKNRKILLKYLKQYGEYIEIFEFTKKKSLYYYLKQCKQ